MPESALPRVQYDVDAQDRIARCEGDWNEFAGANGGPELTADRVAGQSLWDFLHDPDTVEIYRRLMARVRLTGRPISFPYRCDAPDRRRWFRMNALPLDGMAIRFVSECLREEMRPRPMPMESRPGSLMHCCSLCNRIEVGASYMEIEDAAPQFDHEFADGPLRVTYTVCPECETDFARRLSLTQASSTDDEDDLASGSTLVNALGLSRQGRLPEFHPDAIDEEDAEFGPSPDLVVVGIGASAGGLEAITTFFRAVPEAPGVAFVLVQHLSPDFKSHMPELLRKHTQLEVHSVTSGMELQANAIYLLPPGSLIRVKERQLLLDPKVSPRSLSFPIDIFFESLAREYGPKAVAVVLSGSGSDGSRGIIYVKEAGGLVMVQTPESAQFNGMPRSAISTETADYILDPAEMPEHLLRYLNHSPLIDLPRAEHNEESRLGLLEQVIEILAERKNHDFSGYRTKPLMRRILRRMSVVQARHPEAYLESLRSNQAEADQLFSDLLINVTSFFRNEEAFRVLRDSVLQDLVQKLEGDRQLRIWVAACSTGEEVYSVVTLLEDMAHQRGQAIPYRIFATDVDQEALGKASAATYPESALAAFTQEQLRLVFDSHPGQWVVKPEIRGKVVFAPHDLTTDPPFTRMDLILCRNVLIYFRSELQEEVLRHLHFALSPGGYLFLGHSESLGGSTTYFDVVDARWKIFRRNQETRMIAAPSSFVPRAGIVRPQTQPRPQVESRRATPLESMRGRVAELESILQTGMHLNAACLLVTDKRREILHVFGETARILQVSAGRASLSVHHLVAPSLRNALGSAMRRAESEKEPVAYRRLALEDGTGVDLTVSRLSGSSLSRTLFLVLVQFRGPETQNATAEPREPMAAVRINELEEEIASLQDQLRGTLEDASTTSEELQAANEELMASNEELQGTNEELQSVNEELHTINAEHQQKIQELAKLSEDMENLLKSTGIGTIFLDAALTVRKFTPSVSEIVPLLVKDLGRPIGHIAPRVPGVDLESIARQAVQHGVAVERKVGTHTSQWLLRAHPYRGTDGRTTGAVLTFVDLREIVAAETMSARSDAQFRTLAEFIRDAFLLTSPDGLRILYASPRCSELFGRAIDDIVSEPRRWLERVHTEDRERVRDRRFGRPILQEDTIEYRIIVDGMVRWVSDRRFPVQPDGVSEARVAVLLRDISEAKENVRQLRALASALDYQANVDLLTGLHNRRGLARELHNEIERGRRGDGRLTAVLIDVVRLDEVNRNEGHARGDLLLQRVAERLTRALRPIDHLGRISGGRFLVIMPGGRPTELESAIATLRASGAELVASGSELDFVEIEVVPSLASIEDIVLESERLRATSRPKIRSVVPLERLRELTDIASYTALVQPIHDLKTAAITGHEYFARSKILGLAEPANFLRAAESLKILTQVDLLCLEVCARAASAHRQDLPTHLNVLPQTLLVTPPAEVVRLLRERARLTGPVVLEISTTRLVSDPEVLAQCADGLRSQGITVGLDDVGLERGAIEALVAVEPSLIKIEGELFELAAREPGRRRLLERLVRLASGITPRVISDGIESAAAAAVARDLGLSEAQGYIWERPAAVQQA